MKNIRDMGLLSASLMVACGGIWPTAVQHEEMAIRSAQERLPFDLPDCKEPKLMKLGDVTEGSWMVKSAIAVIWTSKTTIGVICGDKRVTYVVTCVNTEGGKITCTPEMNTAATGVPVDKTSRAMTN